MRIRILHVVEAFGLGGGVENGIANLVSSLDSDRFEHVLCAVFRLGPDLRRFSSGIRIVDLGRAGGRFRIQAHSLMQAIRQIAPDVVHSRNWGALEAVPAARWAGVARIIHSEHGVEETSEEPMRRRIFRRVAYSMAHSVFAVSAGLRDSLVRRTGFDDIGVVLNGVDTQRFSPGEADRARMRNVLGIAADEFAFGCVGRLNPIKDYPTAIRAARELAQRNIRFRLFVAGDGPELEALQTQAASLPRDCVRFTGALSDVPGFLRAMDAYVLPSLTEGISNSLLEAMASGLPPVATYTGGNPEVIVDGESGLLFPVGDSAALADRLLALTARSDLRSQLGARALARARERFSLDAMTRRYDDLYTNGVKRAYPAQAVLSGMR
jgi:sugar transferase (PEP-CTERM/EpsH1 system associated)